MKIISNDDSYSDALSTAAFATIPFIAIGAMGHPIILFVSAGLGIMFLCIFMARFAISLRKPEIVKCSKLMDNIMSLMQFPYVAALAGIIFIDKGINATAVLWIALALTIGMVILALMINND